LSWWRIALGKKMAVEWVVSIIILDPSTNPYHASRFRDPSNTMEQPLPIQFHEHAQVRRKGIDWTWLLRVAATGRGRERRSWHLGKLWRWIVFQAWHKTVTHLLFP
jgi:hypothetical protein